MMTNRYEALRKAIDAHPSPGPWAARGKGGKFVSTGGWSVTHAGTWGTAAVPIKADGVIALVVTPVYDSSPSLATLMSNADYIAAANPETIQALLAERDALRAALEQYADPNNWCYDTCNIGRGVAQETLETK